MTFPRVTSLLVLTLCASVAQAQSTAPKELSALLASQAAAEALTSCEKLGHKAKTTELLASHVAMLSRPAEVAKLIVEAAKNARPQ